MRPRNVNWKQIADNYVDALHIPVAHPGLSKLVGKSYGVEVLATMATYIKCGEMDLMLEKTTYQIIYITSICHQ